MAKLIDTKTRKEIIKRDGSKNILLHFTEEIGELLTVINHKRRGKCNQIDVEKEIADVLICLEFVKEILGLGDEHIDLKISDIIQSIKKETKEIKSKTRGVIKIEKGLKNVDLEFVYEEVYPAGMERDEAKQMDEISKHLSKILIKRKGEIIKVIEPMLYNAEHLQGDGLENEFGTLNVYIPDKKELEEDKKTKQGGDKMKPSYYLCGAGSETICKHWDDTDGCLMNCKYLGDENCDPPDDIEEYSGS